MEVVVDVPDEVLQVVDATAARIGCSRESVLIRGALAADVISRHLDRDRTAVVLRCHDDPPDQPDVILDPRPFYSRRVADEIRAQTRP
jgi:hypothetical protein